VSVTKLSSVSRLSPVSCRSNAPFLTPPQNLFCATFPSLNFLPGIPFLVQLSRDLNYPIPGYGMPRGPVQGSVTSTHASCHEATSRNILIGPTPFPLPHPSLSSSCRRSNGRRADLRGGDHAPSFIRSNLNGVPHIVRMTTRHALVTATSCSLQPCHCAAIHLMWKVCLQGASAGSSLVACTHPKGPRKVLYYSAGGFPR